ncbi:MAG TPA: glycosyl hydrolase family 8 [Polyangiaceae bacterium]|nr:glycosyl hydrolase family 8 [Polyangiaceae bacterium]
MQSALRAVARSATSLSLVLVSTSALAQNKPFPHSGGYAGGFTPTGGATTEAKSSYDFWKGKYLKSDCGGGNVRVDNSDGATFSEGMGYGMVLTAYYGDKAEFDGLWQFTKKNFNQNGLMGWHVTCSGPTSGDGGGASATDGDTDIGFALVVAVDQWGDSYKQPALDYLAALKAKDYVTCQPTGRVMATNGDWDQGCVSENTSYFMPAYYRVFAKFTGDSFWSKAADDAIAIWQANANGSSGLVANEVNQSGGLGPQPKDYVDYNGCRVPWRAALDYLWYGTPSAKQFSDKIATWASGVGIQNIVDGYNTDGTPSGSGHYTGMNPWVGGFASGAMTLDQKTVDAFFGYFKSIDNDNGVYYGASLRALYLLMLSGNQWEPLSDGAPPASGTGGTTSSTGGTTGSTGATTGSTGGRTGSTGGSPSGASGKPGQNGGAGSATGGGATAGGSGGATAGGPGTSSADGGSLALEGAKSSGACGCLLAGSSHGTPHSMLAAGVPVLAFFGRRRRKLVPRFH